jgi:ATP-dependent Lhr-like helicase
MSKNQINALNWAHPLVREWFIENLGFPTEPQELGWPAILAGKNTLISAPTGSGKTLAAFLVCIDRLVRASLDQNLTDATQILYVSPLKALSNDIHKNLTVPLNQIKELAQSKGLVMQEIRVAVRTGDTPTRERQLMLKKPPHILVTTPESLYILLTAQKSSEKLRAINTIIIDEIHAMANDKRGSHLTLSLERLENLLAAAPIRIGLSATQKPIERVADFLMGIRHSKPVIVNIGHAKHMELGIEVPGSELGPVASNEMWDEIYDRLAQLALENRSTLIFTNTRRLAERIAHQLSQRLGEDQVAAHHGSLSRKIRLEAETKLKQGELKALVATASLELGIDIGSIDLVCQIGSPRAIANALQRVGRAGHWHGAISKGKFIVTTRDELLECAALVKAIKEGDLDQLLIPEQPLDILAQQIVAACATCDWSAEDLYQLVIKAYPYRQLTRETFNEVITMLSEGIAGSRGRYGAYLFHDQINGVLKGRRGSRLTAIMSGGAIPDNGLFTVVLEPQGVMVGTLDEDFAVESNRGDIILLGTSSWIIRRVESASGRVLVEDAHGAPPSVPFWRGEAPARTQELSFAVSDLRRQISSMLPTLPPTLLETHKQNEAKTALDWLQDRCGVDALGAEQLVEYILQGRAVLGAVPTQDTVIAERFFDEGGGMQLIIHAPFGARINKAWGLALRKKFCRSFNFELQAAATDDGLNISLAEQHSFPLGDVFHYLHPNTIKDVLTQAVLQSPLFNTRWRWDATRALALVRFRNGKKIPPNIQRMLADDLLAAVFPDAAACQDNLGGRDIELPDHPLITETMKDALTEALDVEGLTDLLHKIKDKKINCLAVDTPIPSVFSHEILNANPYAFLDDAPLEERRARAVEMRRIIPESILEEVGKLDLAAISEVQSQAWPDIRSADELHDTLQTVIAMPEKQLGQMDVFSLTWKHWLDELIAQGRAGIAKISDKRFWFAAERQQQFSLLYPEAQFEQQLNLLVAKVTTKEEVLVSTVRGWLLNLGPTTNDELSVGLQIVPNEIEQALLTLEASGFVLRGHFKHSQQQPLEWCERRLLARIHRLTLGRLRQEISPVTTTQFMRWLLKWQHLAKGTQLHGEQGLLEVIKQLQGYEIAASAWERKIFAKRIVNYDASLLDRLCLSGVVGWGRLSPHPAAILEVEAESEVTAGRRIKPSSIAPITFFLRNETQWLMPCAEKSTEDLLTKLSFEARSIYQYLLVKGASFFTDIERGVRLLKAQVETALWELVAAGLITADGFDNLRSLIDPHRRLDRRFKGSRARFSSGRWSILEPAQPLEHAKQLEALCWVLLKRYGVVFRDLLCREKNLPRWRELLVTFRRLEDRGEIRGGRFVSGFLGEQFALPYAVESLRAIRKTEPDGETLSIYAVDPLNLVGTILPGERTPAQGSNKIMLQDGQVLPA